MKIRSCVVDKTIKAWTFIIWISVSHTIAVNQEMSDAIEKINNTSSNNGSDLHEGSNSLFPFVIPQFGKQINETGNISISYDSTVFPEPTTKLEQTDETFKPSTLTSLPISKSSDALTTRSATIPSSSAKPEVATQTKEHGLPTTTTTPKITTTTKAAAAATTTTDVPKTTLITTTLAPATTTMKDEETTTITDTYTTHTVDTKLISTSTRSMNTSSNTAVTPRKTPITSDITSSSTSGLMPSSSTSLSSKSVSTTKPLSNSSTNETTHSEYLTAANSTDNSTELYSNTTDHSRLTHTLADDFQSSDSFWPIALALTISIPTIVVLAITIAVLYRRRIAKPRSLLSMYGQFS